jgi:hypothetical protein
VLRDPEPGGGERDVPLRFLKRRQEVLAHRLVPTRSGRGRLRSDRTNALHVERAQGLGGHDARVGEQGRPFDDIGELADVPGPGVGEQAGLRPRVQAQAGQAILGAGAGQEALGKEQDVASEVAQRGQVEREHGQPMVEVLAEAPGADRRLEIRVGGADQPDVGGLRAGAAQAADGAVLDGGEELGLGGLREERDLVEEEHAAVGGLEEATLGAAGIGEGALLEAEELGLEEGLRDGGAVDVDEGGAAAGAVAMEQAGDQALAGAGLALEEDRREALPGALPVEQPAQLVPDHLDGRALTEQFDQLVHDPCRPRLADCSPIRSVLS